MDCPYCGESILDCICYEDDDAYPLPPSKPFPECVIQFEELPF